MADKRSERSSKSVINLCKLLRKVCESPEAYRNDEYLRTALKSQGGLAKYSNNDFDITPTSINTIKRVAYEVVDGGFKALDDLRTGALERIEHHELKEKKSNKRTRVGLVKRVDELENDVMKLEQINFLLVQSITETISDIKSIANIESSETRNQRSKEAIRKLMSIMSINPAPFDRTPSKPNIVPLNRKQQEHN